MEIIIKGEPKEITEIIKQLGNCEPVEAKPNYSEIFKKAIYNAFNVPDKVKCLEDNPNPNYIPPMKRQIK